MNPLGQAINSRRVLAHFALLALFTPKNLVKKPPEDFNSSIRLKVGADESPSPSDLLPQGFRPFIGIHLDLFLAKSKS